MSITPHSRREFLKLTSRGISAYALSSLINSAEAASSRPKLHHRPRAKSVIFLFMSGGFSHVDSFDPKPMLKQRHGQPMPVAIERTQFDNNGNIMASPWEMAKYGQSGLEMTNMFPKIAERADDLAIIRSLNAKFSEHATGNFFLHTGFPFLGYPSAGAWVNYGCGTMNPNLPGYIVLQSKKAGTPVGGVSMFGNAFLPATNQGSIFNLANNQAVPDITPAMLKAEQRRSLDLIGKLDRGFADRVAAQDAVMASVANAETAFLMQEAVPELTDITSESATTRKRYGVDSPNAVQADYARQCLMARRLVERGVRFVELSCCSVGIGEGGPENPWDQHGEIHRGHGAMAAQVDGPIAALMGDLKDRGLLDETLIVFAGEFGRTPFSQGGNGRDHNPFGFSAWLAGGGIKGGVAYGATDEFGYRAVTNVSTVYDLWATVLHQLGIDHERLTFRWGGRDLRLTDVHGNVIREIVA
ncbi:MAG: DUF1501 domain-containing protein [Verrucomicrobia bacterium]|nr:MAG: DUF1501 domain-containing protein [Verrucomicrobiota bacterium]